MRRVLLQSRNINVILFRKQTLTYQDRILISSDALSDMGADYITKRVDTISDDVLSAYIRRYCATMTRFRHFAPLLLKLSYADRRGVISAMLQISSSHLLFSAVAAGSFARSKVFPPWVTTGTDIDFALAAAFSCDAEFDVNEYVTHGADLVQAFHIACLNGWAESVQGMMNRHVSLREHANVGLYLAIKEASLDDDIINSLVVQGGASATEALLVALLDVDDRLENTVHRFAEHGACLDGALEHVLKYHAHAPRVQEWCGLLIRAGASNYSSLLTAAARPNDVTLCETLMGVESVTTDAYAIHQAMCAAAYFGRPHLIEMFMQHMPARDLAIPLRIATSEGHWVACDLMLQTCKRDVDMLNYVLHCAVEHGEVEICRQVLNLGADDLYHALYLACLHVRPAVWDALQHRANPCFVEDLLLHAVGMGVTECVQRLHTALAV